MKKKMVEKNQAIPEIKNILYREVSFWLSIIGIVFASFLYLTGPSRDNDTALKLQDQRIAAQQKTIDGLNLTQQNDTKELKNEVAGLRTEMQVLTNSIVELKTIVAERIPAKK